MRPGVDHQTPMVRKAVRLAHRDPESGRRLGRGRRELQARLRGYEAAPSTASQTAWALLGLMAAGEVEHAAVGRGIAYLAENQGTDGLWDEERYTATGFPRVFYLRYHGYPEILSALGDGALSQSEERKQSGGVFRYVVPWGGGNRMIVVVGMAFEARIAAGLGVPVVCGGDGQNLAASLARAMAAGCGGLISFGVAGGLAPGLKPGTCVIGSAIIDDERRAADRRALGAAADAHHSRHGLRSDRRRARADRASRATSAPCTRKPARSRSTWNRTWWRARPRSMACRSPPSAWWSIRRSAPFRARRSPARGADGTIDPLAVVRSLMRYPRDLDRADPHVARCARGARHPGARQRAARSGPRAARFRAAPGDRARARRRSRRRSTRSETALTQQKNARRKAGHFSFWRGRRRYSAAVR